MTLVAFGGRVDHVLHSNASVTTAGQPAEGEYTVFAQAIHELAGHPDLTCTDTRSSR